MEKTGLPIATYNAAGALEPLAVVVEDNVAGTTSIGGKKPIAGTDVLHLRGIINSSLWEVSGMGGDVAYDDALGTGDVTVRKITPFALCVSDGANYPRPMQANKNK